MCSHISRLVLIAISFAIASGAALIQDHDVADAAHFSGQGYVQLNDGFEIDDWLQIKLQFKTTSQDGVILAMGNVGFPERPCLILELYQGQLLLRMRTKMGTEESMVEYEASFPFDEGNNASDDKWHTVEARVIRTVLILLFDGKAGEFGFSSDAQQQHLGAITQFVGGIPDNLRSEWPLAPKSPNNYRGCIKDLMIKDVEKYEDHVVWTHSSTSLKFYNVDISACP